MKSFRVAPLLLAVLCLSLSWTTPAFAAPETPVIPYCQHEWGPATFTWSENNAVCTATRICTKNAAHAQTETVNSSASTVRVSCTSPAGILYTATFHEIISESVTRFIPEGEALGHVWCDPEYEWSDDNDFCRASSVCARNEAHVITETAPALSRVTKGATAEEDGIFTYYAAFEDGFFGISTLDYPYSFQSVLWGDANGDGAINNKDVARLKKYLANLNDATMTSTVSIFPGADANGDGEIGNDDIIRLKVFFANRVGLTEQSSVVLGPAS